MCTATTSRRTWRRAAASPSTSRRRSRAASRSSSRTPGRRSPTSRSRPDGPASHGRRGGRPRRGGLPGAAAAAALASAAVAVLPDAALAHGLVGRQDLPIPRWLFAWGAAVVLVISFVALAVLWPRPRLEDAPEYRVLSVPTVLEVLAGVLGVAAFGLVVYAGFAGTQTATANITPTVIYVIFWVGIPFASAVFGDVFAAFNPWRAVARGVSWVAGRASGGRPAPRGADPLGARAGWPGGPRPSRWRIRRGSAAGPRRSASSPSRGSSSCTRTRT